MNFLEDLLMPDYDPMRKQCPNVKENLENCHCTYAFCDKKGLCCQCLHYHRRQGELPACYFTPEVEKTYDRSIRHFMQNR